MGTLFPSGSRSSMGEDGNLAVVAVESLIFGSPPPKPRSGRHDKCTGCGKGPCSLFRRFCGRSCLSQLLPGRLLVPLRRMGWWCSHHTLYLSTWTLSILAACEPTPLLAELS